MLRAFSIMRAGLLRIACASALAIVLAACARHAPSRIEPSAPPPGMHSVFVVSHRYHTGLIVRANDIPEDAWPARRDFPGADYLELGWGEREYYPRDDPGVLRGLRALLTPSKSTINVIPITGALIRAVHDSEIVELRVTDRGFMRMVEFIRRSHEFDAKGRPIVIRSGSHQPGRFYASSRTFHAFENCNVWVARALQAAGLPVEPREAITAGMLLRQVRRLNARSGDVINNRT